MCDSAGKESTYSAGDLGLIPGLGRSPRASLVAQMVESACNAGDPGLIIKAIPSCRQFGGQQTQDSCFIRHRGSGSGNSCIGRIENGIFQKVFCTCANHFQGGSKGEYSRVAAY